MTFGKTIRMLRTAQGVSQGEMARSLKVTPSYVSSIEHDRKEPSMGFLRNLANFFEVPVGFLLLGDARNSVSDPTQKRLVEEIHHVLLDYVISRDAGQKTSKPKLRVNR